MVFALPSIHAAYPYVLLDASGLLMALIDLCRQFCGLVPRNQSRMVFADAFVAMPDLCCDGGY